MFTKSQLFTAAAVAASASTVLAAPIYGDVADIEARSYGGDALSEFKRRAAMEYFDELYVRGPGASKEIKDTIVKAATSKAGRKIATEVGKTVYTKVAGNALDEQKKKDAQKKSGSSKRDLNAILEAFEARDFDDLEDLFTRGPGASKEIKDTIVKAATSKAGRKIATEVGKNVYTKVAGNALDQQKKKQGEKKSGSSKRDFEDVLDELFARGPGASKEIKDTIVKAATSKAGRKIATEVGKNVYTKVAGNALDEQKKKDAQKKSGSKRDLEDAFAALAARDFDGLEELYMRGPGASKEIKDTIAKAATSKAGRKIATEVGKNVYTKVAGNALDEQKKKDAAKKSGSSKRDLDAIFDALEARDFDELEELFSRGPGASKEIKDTIVKAATSKAGRKIATEVGKNVYTKVAGNALDEQKKDAQKKSGSSKRDLDALLDAFETRDFDDFEDLYARGPGASKEIKDTIAKAATSKAGRKIATEIGKNVYTKVAGNALDEQKKKDAQKKSGSSKRDLDMILDAFEARDFDDLDELFVRGPGASKEIKDTIAKAATSKAGRKIATEVGKNVYTKVAGNALDEQKKKDAAKHHTDKPKRRELELLDLITRELEFYDDLD